MREVTVKRDDLVGRLKQNRDGHRDEYDKAMEGYRKRVVEWFNEQSQRVLDGKEDFAVAFPHQRPEDHTDDYDNALDMLEMSIDNEITIGVVEFRRYVRDDWEWSASSKFTNSFYTAG